MPKIDVSTEECSMMFETNFTDIPFKTSIDFLNQCVSEFNQTLNHANVFHDWSNLYYQMPQCDERFIR